MTSYPCLVWRVVKPPSLDLGFRMLEANLFCSLMTNSQEMLAYASLTTLREGVANPQKRQTDLLSVLTIEHVTTGHMELR